MPLTILSYLQILQRPRKYSRYALGQPRRTYYVAAWQVYGLRVVDIDEKDNFVLLATRPPTRREPDATNSDGDSCDM